MADALVEHLGREAILFDAFHASEIARPDAALYLPELFAKECELVVLIVSESYNQSDWCRLELLRINDLLLAGRHESVFLCRFGNAVFPNLPSGSIYYSLDGKTALEFAEEIRKRLAQVQALAVASDIRPTVATGLGRPDPITNNLPPLPSFFGRERELAVIQKALDPENRIWGKLIEGPGGMGKTMLAIRAAELAPTGDFQRICFVSAKDRELGDCGERSLSEYAVLEYLSILNEIAEGIGQPEIARTPEGIRAKSLLSALRGQRTLLILDNLEVLTRQHRDQLLSFVGNLPRGNKALLTCRPNLCDSGDRLTLTQLEKPDALAWLEDLANGNDLLREASEADRIELYQHAEGRPLIIRWITGQLGRGHCRTIADAIGFLQSMPSSNDALGFVFGDLLAEFRPEETRVLAALSYCDGPAGLRAIAEVAKLTELSVKQALNVLANQSLIGLDQEGTSFAILPLAADLIRGQRAKLVWKLGKRLKARAYQLVTKRGYEQHESFPILEAAWPTLAPALALFLAGRNKRLQIVCHALEEFLNFTGRWDEFLSLSSQAEARAVEEKDFQKAGWRAHNAGYIHFLRHEGEEAIQCANRAAIHWDQSEAFTREKGYAAHLRALALQVSEKFDEAIREHEAAVAIWRGHAAVSREVAIGLGSLGAAHRRVGHFGEASRLFCTAWRMARAVKYTEGIAFVTGNRSALALDLEKWKLAEKLAPRALILSEQIRRQQLIATNSRRLATALLRQGRAAEAKPHAIRAVEIYTTLRSQSLEAARQIVVECDELNCQAAPPGAAGLP